MKYLSLLFNLLLISSFFSFILPKILRNKASTRNSDDDSEDDDAAAPNICPDNLQRFERESKNSKADKKLLSETAIINIGCILSMPEPNCLANFPIEEIHEIINIVVALSKNATSYTKEQATEVISKLKDNATCDIKRPLGEGLQESEKANKLIEFGKKITGCKAYSLTQDEAVKASDRETNQSFRKDSSSTTNESKAKTQTQVIVEEKKSIIAK